MFSDSRPQLSLRCGLVLWACGVLAASPTQASDGAVFSSWRALRDAGVVKQASDFSCGLAALATYFTTYLNDPLSEAALLRLLEAQGDDWGLPADWREQGVSYAILIALATHLAQFLDLWLDPTLDAEVGTLLLLHNTRRTRQQREGYFTLVPRLPLLRPGLNMALSAGWFADGR